MRVVEEEGAQRGEVGPEAAVGAHLVRADERGHELGGGEAGDGDARRVERVVRRVEEVGLTDSRRSVEEERAGRRRAVVRHESAGRGKGARVALADHEALEGVRGARRPEGEGECGGRRRDPEPDGRVTAAASAKASSMARRKWRATRSRIAGSGASSASPPSAQVDRSGAIQVVKFRSPRRSRSVEHTSDQSASRAGPAVMRAPSRHQHLWRAAQWPARVTGSRSASPAARHAEGAGAARPRMPGEMETIMRG
jgi:hypothetical protein